MAEIQDFNVTDASNTGRWPENMPFANVNNAGRADEGILARWYKDTDASITASGSANAFTATSNRTIAAYFNNLVMAFTANHSIDGAATLNLNGLGAKTIKRFNGDDLASGDIISGQPLVVVYKSSPDVWFMMTAPAALTDNMFVDMSENTPADPTADVSRLYALDQAGLSWLAWRDSSSNENLVLALASKAEMEAGTNSLKGPSVAQQKHHPGHPKAWGYVVSGSFSASFGCTSVTNPSTGTYTVTLSTAMSSTSYCVIASLNDVVSGPTQPRTVRVEITSSSTFNIYSVDTGGLANRSFSFIVLGDQ